MSAKIRLRHRVGCSTAEPGTTSGTISQDPQQVHSDVLKLGDIHSSIPFPRNTTSFRSTVIWERPSESVVDCACKNRSFQPYGCFRPRVLVSFNLWLRKSESRQSLDRIKFRSFRKSCPDLLVASVKIYGRLSTALRSRGAFPFY